MGQSISSDAKRKSRSIAHKFLRAALLVLGDDRLRESPDVLLYRVLHLDVVLSAALLERARLRVEVSRLDQWLF